ncbi:MAG TPA: DNA polymerase III subunit delta [Thioalkalivibrio sp.]|nr:DNA polymerase III subunit delta [Thioalkalivibrio sp.]
MRLRPEQLEAQLAQGLAPIYILSGEEPLQLMEAADAVRAAARAAGYVEREVMTVEGGFDWDALTASADALSLFAERRIIDLRLPSGKPGQPGARALQAYAERPPEDTILLIQSGRLDGNATKSKWYGALESAGVAVQVWPLSPKETREWVAGRMAKRGMEPTDEAVTLVVERVEGNLLAAAQEIDKLSLLHGKGPVEAETVLEAVADSARYSSFDLADAALASDPARAVRILNTLRGEGVEPPLILWSLSRDIRLLAELAFAQVANRRVDLFRQGVLKKRHALLQAAARRGDTRHWRRLLAACARVDRCIKGQESGDPWDELLQLTLSLSGRTLFGASPGPSSVVSGPL